MSKAKVSVLATALAAACLRSNFGYSTLETPHPPSSSVATLRRSRHG